MLSEVEKQLLKTTAFLARREFICFGKYYIKFKRLNFIDSENKITFEGRSMVRKIIKQETNG